jgi:AcrR family transcriptional regulator
MPVAHSQRATRARFGAQSATRPDAACGVLSAHDTEATIEVIAVRAGVGVGTGYRRVPNKDALIDALVTAIMTELTGLVQFLRVLVRSFVIHLGRPVAY